jgi:hypothetical protein
LVILAALAACEPEPEPRIAAALPKSVCDEAQAAMKEATKTGAMLLNNPLEGMIAQEAWLQMPESHRDSLTRTMGLAATCAGGTPQLQQEVMIRSETGTILTRRIIETSYSMPGS